MRSVDYCSGSGKVVKVITDPSRYLGGVLVAKAKGICPDCGRSDLAIHAAGDRVVLHKPARRT